MESMGVSDYRLAGQERTKFCSWSIVLVWGPQECAANPFTVLQFCRKMDLPLMVSLASLKLDEEGVTQAISRVLKRVHSCFPQVADMESGKQIQLINRKSLRALTAQLLVLLMSWEGATHLSVDELKRHYESTHSTPLNPCEYGFMTLTELLKSLPYLVEV